MMSSDVKVEEIESMPRPIIPEGMCRIKGVSWPEKAFFVMSTKYPIQTILGLVLSPFIMCGVGMVATYGLVEKTEVGQSVTNAAVDILYNSEESLLNPQSTWHEGVLDGVMQDIRHNYATNDDIAQYPEP